MRALFALFSGGLFGAGLLVSGMVDTAKVQGWLDVFGDWDPTLAFVLGGAIIPMTIAWWFTMGRAPKLTAEEIRTVLDVSKEHAEAVLCDAPLKRIRELQAQTDQQSTAPPDPWPASLGRRHRGDR